jgi:hypothetical protein
MLPPPYETIYQNLLTVLHGLVELSAPEEWNIALMKSALTEVQQIFQTQLLSLNLNDLDPKLEHQVRSFNVEIDKQLRLLTVDLLFLQSAKQPATIAQRLQQVRDRLQTLIRYCNILLGIE